MTDTRVNLDEVPLHPCVECYDSATPTPIEFAFETLGVKHEDERRHLAIELGIRTPGKDITEAPFSQGWEAGVEANLDEFQLPVSSNDADKIKAWLVGFVAGQYAGANGYPSPYCLNHAHEM